METAGQCRQAKKFAELFGLFNCRRPPAGRKSGDAKKAAEFKRRENALERSRLIREDTLLKLTYGGRGETLASAKQV